VDEGEEKIQYHLQWEREEWREKLSKAQTQEEFLELFDRIGAATGVESEPKPATFLS
jgi:hypothetical protein